MSQLRSITECTDLEGKYVIVRGSLNVPVRDGQVVNQFRLARALPTLQYLVDNGARVILIAHIGRGQEETLRPVFEVLRNSLPITFNEHVLGPEVHAARQSMQNGQVLMLENVRSDLREKLNDAEFAQQLAALGDIYVCDAFAAGHREHASIVGIPQYLPSYAGINFMHEHEELVRTLTPEHPALFILGGAKFETKMPLVEKFLEAYDHVFIGGALAHDIFRARGQSVGASLVSEVDLTGNPIVNNEKLVLPVDFVIERDGNRMIIMPTDVQEGDVILDAGPETLERLKLFTKGAKTILWNGPLGNYEQGYGDATEGLAKYVAESEAYSVVGGGDTVAAIESLGLSGQFGFMSTGGGAMLAFLEHSTLPAIEALKNSRS